ncbi:dTDP-4-dehydrorhamnose 3,5-epimerase [Psychrobacter jeotgali]|uniref:dTDP-4-dehydrorhamnose 3,5-epimerase n=1 Tax=Psychrobacter jeotgali TaxID=179010 RepID=UPI00191AC474|nr:dTDP-4-dehydrorhamnose 3,5-epimerase [Psychrobacter jeotgali]
MNTIPTKIPEVLILEPRVFADDRGWFMESFNQQTFADICHEQQIAMPSFVQDNHSLSKRGVLRGLHYQLPPFAQGKLIRVVQGRAWDVAVDIRQHSPTFGQWVGVELSATNHRQLWIPAGFAHGFLALEDDTQFVYKTTSYYNKNSERTIVWNDKDLDITWPTADLELKLTDKDSDGATFVQAIKNADVF